MTFAHYPTPMDYANLKAAIAAPPARRLWLPGSWRWLAREMLANDAAWDVPECIGTAGRYVLMLKRAGRMVAVLTAAELAVPIWERAAVDTILRAEQVEAPAVAVRSAWEFLAGQIDKDTLVGRSAAAYSASAWADRFDPRMPNDWAFTAVEVIVDAVNFVFDRWPASSVAAMRLPVRIVDSAYEVFRSQSEELGREFLAAWWQRVCRRLALAHPETIEFE